MQAKTILTLLVLAFGGAQAAQAQDLETIYELALEQDAELRIAEANYLAAVQGLPIAEAARRPQISLNADASVQESDNSVTGDNDIDSLGYSLDLTQSLYDTEVSNSINAASASVDAALAEVQAAREGLILRVTETYFGVLAAQDNVEFAEAERTAIARQLEQAQKRFEVGLIAITDVQEAQARFDNAEAQLILAQNLLDNSFQALAVITGEPSIRNLARLGEDLELAFPNPADAAAWEEVSLEFNRDVLAARKNLEVARFERQRRSTADYPTVDLRASYSDSDVDNDLLGDSDQEDLILAIQVQVPLYTGGRISAEEAQAEADFVAAKNNVLLQTRLASQQSRTAYLDVVSGISQVNALKQALESSKIALEATRAGFEVGTRTSVDVLIALRETFRAERDFAGSRYEYLVNTLRLREAAGILNAGDLSAINRWLIE
ncbi:MAG: TolC family outer membrane protein [Gammaproteobacteria bacterium]|nr:TolC family outer membrane protein [Gammaproteobacteria bacterium]